MTTYNTGNPIGSTDARDLYDNAQNLDNFANGTSASYSDRLGVTRRSLAGIESTADGVLNGIGYQVPVTYASGISLTLTSQTVDYNGVIYAPKSSALPFTTSSWGADSVKFRAVQVTDADLITYTPAGTGAVATTVQSKLREMVSVKDFGADPAASGAANTAAFQAALNASASVYVPAGTYTLDGTIVLGSSKKLFGDGPGATVISYAGAAAAISFISNSGSGTRIYNGGLSGLQISTSTGQIGVDADSLSEADFQDVIVSGFSVAGFKLHSSTSGGAVYNRFYSVKAQGCGIGFWLIRDGAGLSSYTSDNTFIACRANTCTTGFSISGGNHNVISASQIESCTTGISVTEPATASVPYNTISLCRFENNTTDVSIGAGVVEAILQDNAYINGDRVTDAGTRTQTIGATAQPHIRASGYQIPGGSFRYIRTANGGTQVPHTVFHEASSINSPVTVEIQSSATSTDARALRVRYGGDAGTLKFGIVPINGKITDLSTTNGPTGGFTCSAAASTVISNTAVSADSRIFIQAANASAAQLVAGKGIYVSNRTADTSFQVNTGDGTAAAGTEQFWFWIVN